MDLTPEEKQKIYLEEKERLEAQEKIKKEKKDAETKKGCLGCLIILFVAIIIGLFNSCGSSKPSDNGQPSIAQSQQSSSISTPQQNTNNIPLDMDLKSYTKLILPLADEVEASYNEVEKSKKSTTEIANKQDSLSKKLNDYRFNKASKQLILWQHLAYADGCINSLRFSYDDKLEGKVKADQDIAYFKSEITKNLQKFRAECNDILNDRPFPENTD